MAETMDTHKDGKTQTSTFCVEVCKGHLGSCLGCVVDHMVFENWLKQNYRENGIFVNT
jgi:hypothetical protein